MCYKLFLLAIVTMAVDIKADTILGFVVDDTGSMRNEIPAVKLWIKGCIASSGITCAADKYLVGRFNDPDASVTAPPTNNIGVIYNAIDNLSATGGGDCPEYFFTGLEKAINAIPATHTGCKVYIMTDATAKDSSKFSAVKALFKAKKCKAYPLLTGCCGVCADSCKSTSPDYCINHIIDTSTVSPDDKKGEASKSSSRPGEFYYKLAEATGGSVLIADKPSSPKVFSDLLSKKLTLGFCPTNKIAGPGVNGYCEAQCLEAKMCWDKGERRCYCNHELECPSGPMFFPKCPEKATCPEDEPEKFIPDAKACDKYYLCTFGAVSHKKCPAGKLFRKDSTATPCDIPENVYEPCGTRSPFGDSLFD